MDETDERTGQSDTQRGIRRVWLVRHGVTRWNREQRLCGHQDIPLSPSGRAQARWLARRLQAEPIAAIYSSDLARARETAEIIARARSGQELSINLSAAWRELSFGAWEGLTYAQIAQRFAGQLDFFTDPLHHAPPGGESYLHLVERVQAAFAEIAQADLSAKDAAQEGNIVIVSHGGALRALLCSILNMPLNRQWQLCLDPGSLSALDLLPPGDATAPLATLALLNAQRPVRRRHSAEPVSHTAQIQEVAPLILNSVEPSEGAIRDV
jgi:alpha-ribazole phosphatase